jgi:hypothetical protein
VTLLTLARGYFLGFFAVAFFSSHGGILLVDFGDLLPDLQVDFFMVGP